MEFALANGITQFAEGEPKVGSVHNKTTQLKTSPGWTPPPESFLTALPSRKAAASKNLFRRKAPPPRWIATVSAATETSREVRKVHKVMKGGNGASTASEVTLCSNHAYLNDATQNPFWIADEVRP